MYAVIRTGGKQYKVAEGDTLEVEHLVVKGNKITFTPILVVTDEGKTIYGRKDLKPYSVVAKVVGDTKGDKVDILKYKSKSGYAVRQGHRQLHSMIEITGITSKSTSETASKDKSEAGEKAGTGADDGTKTSATTEKAAPQAKDPAADDSAGETAAESS